MLRHATGTLALTNANHSICALSLCALSGRSLWALRQHAGTAPRKCSHCTLSVYRDASTPNGLHRSSIATSVTPRAPSSDNCAAVYRFFLRIGGQCRMAGRGTAGAGRAATPFPPRNADFPRGGHAATGTASTVQPAHLLDPTICRRTHRGASAATAAAPTTPAATHAT